MGEPTKIELKATIEQLQRKIEATQACLAGFIADFYDNKATPDDEVYEWALLKLAEAKGYTLNPKSHMELWHELFSPPQKETSRYRLRQNELIGRIAELERVMTSNQEQLVEQFSTLREQLQSALLSNQSWNRKIHSLWLLAHGMPEPWPSFIFSIIGNGTPPMWNEGKEFFIESRAFPGWAWRDGRAKYPLPSSEFRPSTDGQRERVEMIRAIRENLVQQERRVTRLIWEYDLSVDNYTEDEINQLRDIVWPTLDKAGDDLC